MPVIGVGLKNNVRCTFAHMEYSSEAHSDPFRMQAETWF